VWIVINESGTRLGQAEVRLDQAEAVLETVGRVLEVAEKAERTAERARKGLRTVNLVVVGSAVIVAIVVLVSRRQH
jgi:uncharacterized membrane protein YhiD involved in acid resistance